MSTRSVPASLYPRLGLTTIDSTVLRYDPDQPRFPVCFVATDGDGVEIAWDICGVCLTYVGICRCPNGPGEPAYIYRLRTGEHPPKGALRPVTIGTRPGGEIRAAVRPSKRPVWDDPAPSTYPRAPKPGKAPAAAPKPVEAKPLDAPCARHTAESRLRADGTYVCTVAGCEGIA